MSGNDDEFGGFDLEDIIRRDTERKQRKLTERPGTITCREYIELVRKDSTIAQRSQSRFYEIIMNGGVEDIPPEERWFGVEKRYPLFSNRLFGPGIEKAVQDLVEYCAAGVTDDPVAKQLLVLVGPPAGGKSSLIDILTEALETYSVRPVYQIAGCPVRHDPLFLLPRYLRKDFEQELSIPIRGDLCPVCRDRLEKDFTDDDGTVRWWDFPVEPFTFSVQGSRGIGSFEPGDDLTADITALTGRENVAITSTKGHDDPRAYTLSGEIEKANRGILEGVEMLLNKLDILRVFISLCEEGQIKVQGSNFPHIWIDTMPVGHINMTGFYKFSANKEYEGLHNRTFVIMVPYPIRIKDEVRIYQKLMHEDREFVGLGNAHIAPGAFQLAATFAVMTRLLPPGKVDELTKAKFYNGEFNYADFSDKTRQELDPRELLAEGQANEDIGKREGMFGVSSRDIMAALNTAHKRQKGKNGCLTPKRALRALHDVFDHRMGYTPEQVARFREMLTSGEGGTVMSEYRRFATENVSRAFLRAYEDLVDAQSKKYVQEARRYRAQKRKFVRGQMEDIERDEMTGKPKVADEKFLKAVEQHMGIDSASADTFRGEVIEYVGSSLDPNVDYPPLRKAIERKVLEESKDSLLTVLSTDVPKGGEERKRAQDLVDGLTDMGFCPVCAQELTEDAREFLSE